MEGEASDAASGHAGNRQRAGSPSNESTRADEIPLALGEHWHRTLRRSQSDLTGRAGARTAAPSAFSSARSPYRTSGREPAITLAFGRPSRRPTISSLARKRRSLKRLPHGRSARDVHRGGPEGVEGDQKPLRPMSSG